MRREAHEDLGLARLEIAAVTVTAPALYVADVCMYVPSVEIRRVFCCFILCVFFFFFFFFKEFARDLIS